MTPQGPRLHEEQIGVKFPNGTHHIVTVRVSALEEDEAILKRLASEVGTVFNVTGVKYKLVSKDPFELQKLSEPEGFTGVLPVVGETWKPKDPRRKTSFTVVEVDEDSVLTDDGRRIQLARFHRYERITG